MDQVFFPSRGCREREGRKTEDESAIVWLGEFLWVPYLSISIFLHTTCEERWWHCHWGNLHPLSNRISPTLVPVYKVRRGGWVSHISKNFLGIFLHHLQNSSNWEHKSKGNWAGNSFDNLCLSVSKSIEKALVSTAQIPFIPLVKGALTVKNLYPQNLGLLESNLALLLQSSMPNPMGPSPYIPLCLPDLLPGNERKKSKAG